MSNSKSYFSQVVETLKTSWNKHTNEKSDFIEVREWVINDLKLFLERLNNTRYTTTVNIYKVDNPPNAVTSYRVMVYITCKNTDTKQTVFEKEVKLS